MAHVLLPTDLSEASLKAATLAVDLYGAMDNTFTLVHAFSAVGLADPTLTWMLPDLQQANNDALESFERRLRVRCDLSKATVRRIAAFGPLSAAIDHAAREHHPDLIVMSSAGRQGFTLFGTNATNVIGNANVPVLEVPEGIRSLSFRRILFADDQQPIDPTALQALADIARLARAELIIAHVATGRPAHERTDNRALLKHAFAAIEQRTVMVESDDVKEALLQVANRERVDLIALLHRHRGIWRSLFHSSTTKEMALDSPMPVLALEQ